MSDNKNELNLGLAIDDVVKPFIEDELDQPRENEKVLYTLTPEQTEAYLDFAAHYNTATRLKKKVKKLERIGEAKKTLFFQDMADSSVLVEKTKESEDMNIGIRVENGKPVVVSTPETKSGGLPDFLRDILDR